MNTQTYEDTKLANREAGAERSRLAQLRRDRKPGTRPVPNRASRRADGRYRSAGLGRRHRAAVKLLNDQARVLA